MKGCAGLKDCVLCHGNESGQYIFYDRSNIKMHLHHIVPRRYGGTDATENLVKLCKYCHARVHKQYADLAMEKALAAEGNDFFKRALDSLMPVIPEYYSKPKERLK